MHRRITAGPARLAALALFTLAAPTLADVVLVQRAPDPHGSPRPQRDARDVPLRTSLYFELGLKDAAPGDKVDPESVAVRLTPDGGEPIDLLRPGRTFAEGASGWVRTRQGGPGFDKVVPQLAVYVEPGAPLKPETTYTARVTARTAAGAELSEAAATWKFTTEAAPGVRPVRFDLDLGSQPVRWHGAFFSGLCNVTFMSDAETYGPTYDLMARASRQHPRAWSYQRDFWMTGSEDRPQTFFHRLPNVLRERETRRIAAIEPQGNALLLRVEDFYGHEQYGIPAGRPVSDDYHPGDEVLIADGENSAKTKVLSADDAARTVLVEKVETPAGGWKIDYDAPLPTKEDPDQPGLFAHGGCYLRKLRPHGTPCYYWGRLDKEWDLLHKNYGRRLMVNFADAPGDLSIDGRNWTTAKDYAEWHEVVRTITLHLIDRYGDDSLDFTWSVFNEPDLGGLFWRTDWNELQKFYDYTTDGILRAFEDRGYDSGKVFIGGLELGIFPRLTEFLAHCSPTATAKGTLPKNAAVADPRLDGKRSRRVEELCAAHDGKGAPCDFISMHAYNNSANMANKLIKAKEAALKIDADYYRDLWVNSHESCPDWMPPPDEAASDAYLGNGYFPAWCVDVAARQLRKAADDPRFAFGETLLTVWPPPRGLAGTNAITRILNVDDDGDGRGDRSVTIPFPVFHALTLLSDLGDRYWVLPERTVGGHVVTGFASKDDKGVLRAVLYAHDGRDTQSRSDSEFDVTLDLKGADAPKAARVTTYRFDRAHNSPFDAAKALLRPAAADPADAAKLAKALQGLEGDDPAAQRQAVETLKALGPAATRDAAGPALQLLGRTKDPAVRDAVKSLVESVFASGPRGQAYPRDAVETLVQLSELQGSTAEVRADAEGLGLTARLTANGVCFLVIEPAPAGK